MAGGFDCSIKQAEVMILSKDQFISIHISVFFPFYLWDKKS